MSQPDPKPGIAPATWDLVVADMKARDATGASKYGVRHQHDNGRDHLVDAYEEALDLAVYLRAEIEKRKARPVLDAGCEVLLNHLDGPVCCRVVNVRGPLSLPPGQPLLRIEIIGSNPEKPR